MTPIFTEKNINLDERVGERLRQRRTILNLSLYYISKKTGIKQEYLIAMENENFNLLPTGLYGRNFLIKYAKFLKLNPEEIIKKSPFKEKKEGGHNPFSKKILNKNNFLIFPKIIRNILLIIIILLFFSYLFFSLIKAREVPELIIYSPETDILINENIVEVSGRTDPAAQLSINGELIVLEDDGYFLSNITLSKGINKIIIISQKKYSQENIIERQVLVQ